MVKLRHSAPDVNGHRLSKRPNPRPAPAKPLLVTLSPGGAARRRVPIQSVEVPDVWDLAMWLRRQGRLADCETVLELWGLAHDLRGHIAKRASVGR